MTLTQKQAVSLARQQANDFLAIAQTVLDNQEFLDSWQSAFYKVLEDADFLQVGEEEEEEDFDESDDLDF